MTACTSRSRHVRHVAGAAMLTVVLGLTLAATRPGPERPAVGTPKPRPIAGGPFEASGVAHVPGTDGVLFLDDERTQELLWMELTPQGTQKGTTVPVQLAADVTDPEGITSDGTHFFVVGSQSKPKGFDGDGLVRFRFDARTRRITGTESVRDLKGFLAEHVAELHGTGRLPGDEVLNIEGLGWDPRGDRLLLGLRAPLADNHALIVPLVVRDRSRPFSRENLDVPGGRAIRLPLGGVGIRSLEYDSRAGAFRVITGAVPDPETEDFRLLEWDGEVDAPGLRELARFHRTLKPEGITGADIGGRVASVLVFDTGRFTLME